MGARFIWHDLNVEVQPAICQTFNGCSFTAVVRQFEYDLRIRYAQSKFSCALPDGPMFRHEEWEHMLRMRYPEKKRWKPWELLKMADRWFEQNGEYVKGTGCPDANGFPIFIKGRSVVPVDGDDASKIREICERLDRRLPVIAVINVGSAYTIKADSPYLTVDKLDAPESSSNALYSSQSRRNYQDKHAVVIVGEYRAVAGDEYDLDPGIYFLYQDSLQQGRSRTQKSENSLFGNMINILHPRVIKEAFVGWSRIPTVLQERMHGARAQAVKASIERRVSAKFRDKIALINCQKNH